MNIEPLLFLDIPWVSEMALRSYTASTNLGFHRNEGYELIYILSGHYRWELESGKLLDVRGNQVSLTRPDTMHRGFTDHISPGTILYIVFNPERMIFSTNDVADNHMREQLVRLLEDSGDSIYEVSSSFRNHINTLVVQLKEAQSAETLSEFSSFSLVHSIFQALLLFFRDVEAGKEFWDTSPLQGVITYIREHIGDTITMDVLVQRSGWSRSRIYQLFAEHTGQSPNDYIQSLRCDLARERLSGNAMQKETVTKIAHRLGFSSSQYFARVFKKYTGMTPSAYRKRTRCQPI